jgi:hypothetical protein
VRTMEGALTSSKREFFSLCIQSLCPQAQEACPADLRLAGHLLRDLVIEGGEAVVDEWMDAIPWLYAAATLSENLSEVADVADFLARRGALQRLSATYVEKRLRQAVSLRSKVARSPLGSGDLPVVDVVLGLSLLANQMSDLAEAPLEDQRSAIVGDTRLMSACMGHADAQEPCVPVVVELADAWEPSRLNRRALEVLGELEETDSRRRTSRLTQRVFRFESRAAQHLADHDCLRAVRVALSVDATPLGSRPLHPALSAAFEGDPGLAELCNALISVRGCYWQTLHGAYPMDSIDPWVMYLRGSFVSLSEARDWSLREGLNFAHYCLHTMNLCDMLAITPTATDRDRSRLMVLEDEIKEFVVLSQERALSDTESSLSRYEALRWSVDGHLLALTDRIVRMVSPTATPPEEVSVYDRVFDHLSAWEERTQGQMAWSLSALLRRAHILGTELLLQLPASGAIGLLVMSAAWARDGGSTDISCPYVVDLRPLLRWVSEHHSRLSALKRFLNTVEVDRWLFAYNELPALRYGLTARSVPQSIQTLEVCFVADAETEAIMTLLECESQDQDLAEILRRRLADRLIQLESHLGEPPAPPRLGGSEPDHGLGPEAAYRD